MPRPVCALLMTLFFGSAAVSAVAQTVKEFQSSDGQVRVSAAPAFASETAEPGGAPRTDSAQARMRRFSLDSLADLTALPPADEWFDPLLDVYFLDYGTGRELRFPAKLSQIREFLLSHADAYAGGTPESRSIAMIRDLSRDLGVHMRAPGSAGTK